MKRMEAAGVSAVVVACNTVHHFYDEIYRLVPIPWVHLQLETAAAVRRAGLSSVGILATEGANRTRLYSRALEAYGLAASEPDPDSPLQSKVTRAIYDPRIGIKATGSRVSTEARELLSAAISEMQVDAVVAGCTELSLAFQQMNLRIRWYDPLAIAAEVLYALWSGERTTASLRAML
jgi:aspartate racemase